MPGGRLTEYTEDHNEKAIEYIEYTDDAIPSIAGLALFLGVDRSTVYKWRNENPEFSYTLARLLLKQEQTALNKGLTGDFTPAITKLVLANHGYSDRIEQNTTAVVKVTGEMSDAELERIANGK